MVFITILFRRLCRNERGALKIITEDFDRIYIYKHVIEKKNCRQTFHFKWVVERGGENVAIIMDARSMLINQTLSCNEIVYSRNRGFDG